MSKVPLSTKTSAAVAEWIRSVARKANRSPSWIIHEILEKAWKRRPKNGAKT